MAIDTVPLFEFQALEKGSPKQLEPLRSAVETLGAFRLLSHDVSEQTIAEGFAHARAFFSLDEAELKRLEMHQFDVLGGYIPLFSEGLPADVEAGKADAKRSFFATREDFTRSPMRRSVWPEQLKGFRENMTTLYEGLSRIAERIRRVLAQTVGQSADFFEGEFGAHENILKLIHYPVLDPSHPSRQREHRAAAHTDYEFITVLFQEDAPGGLQVQAPDGRWIDVPPHPNELVVTVGELLAHWTGRQFRPALHRVKSPALTTPRDQDRISLVLFHQPNRSCVIRPVKGAARAIVAGDYLKQRLTYG